MSQSFSSPVLCDGISVQSLGAASAVLSTDVARHFQKKHQHILRDIDRLCSILPKSFNASNFGRVEYEDAKGEKRPAYLLTRDAFSLLVMGMTGQGAILWKLRYIEAFNALEASALSTQTELAREAGYQQGRDETLCLPAVQAERQAGYLAGMKEGKRLAERKDRLKLAQRALAYRRNGLSQRETARLLNISRSTLQGILQRVAALEVV